MKSLVLIASSLFAVTASAGEFSRVAPVLFQSASAFIDAKDVCVEGATLKHKSKAAIEVTYYDESDSGHKYNYRVVSKKLAQPVKGLAQRCAIAKPDSSGGACAVWETYTLDQSKVNVYSYNSLKDLEEGRNSSITGTFAIPACAAGNGTAN